MVYERTAGGQKCIVALNPSGKAVKAVLPHVVAAEAPTDNTAFEQGAAKVKAAKPQTLIVSGKASYKSGRSDVVSLGPVSAAVFCIK